jgi:UPF0042 nucleotide-binding protein
MADQIIDTSSHNVHQLKDAVQRIYLSTAGGRRLVLVVTSFGYRYGIPVDADTVLDVRFMRNPYFVQELRELNGHDERIRGYVLDSESSRGFVEKLFDLMAFLVPLYEKEGKTRLNVALGCTGGKHRSVVMANELAAYFNEKGYPTYINHRDITKS